MLIDLTYLVNKHNIQIRGVLHVGAHKCEEDAIYSQNKAGDVIWVEGNPYLCSELQKTRSNVHHAVISNIDGAIVDFIITNNGESSSILELHDHKIEHPHIHEVNRIKMKTTTLNTLLQSIGVMPSAPAFNFVNLDIQGAELLALQGLSDYIHHVDFIYTEVNIKELYKGNALLPDLDAFLSACGFDRAETQILHHGWGDALYIRRGTAGSKI